MSIAKDKISRSCLRDGALRPGWEDSMQCPGGVSSYAYSNEKTLNQLGHDGPRDTISTVLGIRVGMDRFKSELEKSSDLRRNFAAQENR